jgi:hypothetical protein
MILTLGFAFAFWTLLAPCILALKQVDLENFAPKLCA